MAAPTPAQLAQFERELRDNPALVEQILRVFPPVPEAQHIIIKTDKASVDAAIRHALVLAVEGVEARIEFTQL